MDGAVERTTHVMSTAAVASASISSSVLQGLLHGIAAPLVEWSRYGIAGSECCLS